MNIWFILYISLVVITIVLVLVISISKTHKTKELIYVADNLSQEFKKEISSKFETKILPFKEIVKVKSGKVILTENINLEELSNHKKDQKVVFIEELEDVKPFPRIIHQVYLGYSGPMPEDWENYHELWKEYAQQNNWEIKLWNLKDCQDLIKESDYPEFLELFNTYKYGVQKADAIRYFILYKYGGIYSDLDVYPNHNIEPMLQMYEQNEDIKALFCTSPQDRTVSNWFMIARPNFRFFLNCISLMSERHSKTKVNKHFTILWSTGPIMVKNVIAEYQSSDEIYIIPREILTSCTFCTKNCNKFALLTNDQSGTWNSGQTKMLNALTCAMEPVKELNWISWVLIVVLIVVVAVVVFIVTYNMYATCRNMCM